jgi:hypothetical protein
MLHCVSHNACIFQKIERREKIEQIVRERERQRMEVYQRKWSRREEADFFRTISTYGVEFDRWVVCVEYRNVNCFKMAVFWDVAPCSPKQSIRVMNITLMMEAVSFSEASVNIYQTTQCNIPEDSCLHTCQLENLKLYT